jgi:hypothetical protein
MRVFIDESGDTGIGTKSTKHFILALVVEENNYETKRIISKTVKKFKHLRSGLRPLHAYKEGTEVHSFLIKEILNSDLKFYCIINKKKFNSSSEVLLNTFHLIKDIFAENTEIFFSQRETNKNINLEIIGNLLLKFQHVRMSRSEKQTELQLADFIAWICFRHFEKGKSEFYKLIENKIEIVKPQVGQWASIR